MLLVVQRVKSASLDADGVHVTKIGEGLVVFAGIFAGDGEADIQKAADKISGLRIFRDENDKMNLSVADIGGEVLLVPNFTVCGDTSHGRRPDFFSAEKPAIAAPLFDSLAAAFNRLIPTKTGVFGAHMRVLAENDGPVTVLIDTRAKAAKE